MPRQSHSSRFYHPHSIGWGVQIMKLLIMEFSPLLYVSLNSTYLRTIIAVQVSKIQCREFYKP
jgi:hypothetical protein